MYNHLASHIKNHELNNDSTLHVIGVCTNPVRFQSRVRLARKWIEEMEKTPNVKAYVVEGVYGDRLPEVAELSNDRHHIVKIKSEIWLKENLINIGVKNLLPKDWKYMAWVDMDVHFRDSGWALSTIHQLQHYNLVQPWSHASDLDFHGGIHATHKSFGYLHAQGKQKHHGKGKDGYEYAHTGFGWACSRYFYENVEKLLDFCIFGSGDHHMAWACLGLVKETIHSKVSPGYLKRCFEWQEKAMRATANGVLIGFTHGRIEHNFHGPKTQRQYWNRWMIPIEHGFDPTKDLAYDSQGILQFVGPKKYEFERDIMQYNRQRLEDSIEQY
jgi:hypothetical protein